MTIFVVCRVTNPDLVGPAIKQKFPNDHLQLKPDEWLVAAKGTARGISDHIGITSGEKPALGSAMVFATVGYYGFAQPEIWEWIKTKTEATGG
jgi:hypothetical protein